MKTLLGIQDLIKEMKQFSTTVETISPEWPNKNTLLEWIGQVEELSKQYIELTCAVWCITPDELNLDETECDNHTTHEATVKEAEKGGKALLSKFYNDHTGWFWENWW